MLFLFIVTGIIIFRGRLKIWDRRSNNYTYAKMLRIFYYVIIILYLHGVFLHLYFRLNFLPRYRPLYLHFERIEHQMLAEQILLHKNLEHLVKNSRNEMISGSYWVNVGFRRRSRGVTYVTSYPTIVDTWTWMSLVFFIKHLFYFSHCACRNWCSRCRYWGRSTRTQ